LSGPEFGPGGYLPPKAAKRARKIVLREQMGFGWPLAALAAAVLVGITGLLFLRISNQPPGQPFIAMGPLTQVPVGAAQTLDTAEGSALIVRAGGSLRAFRAEPGDVTWCPESARLESDDAAWTPDGRLVHGEGQESLVPLRSVAYDGVVYVDLSTSLARPQPGPAGGPPVCGGAPD
jgi:hypothetical protein